MRAFGVGIGQKLRKPTFPLRPSHRSSDQTSWNGFSKGSGRIPNLNGSVEMKSRHWSQFRSLPRWNRLYERELCGNGKSDWRKMPVTGLSRHCERRIELPIREPVSDSETDSAGFSGTPNDTGIGPAFRAGAGAGTVHGTG